jgi:hypothetical protein
LLRLHLQVRTKLLETATHLFQRILPKTKQVKMSQ